MIEDLIRTFTEYIQAVQANAEAGPENKVAAQVIEEEAAQRFKESMEDVMGAFSALLEQYGGELKDMFEKLASEMEKKKEV